MVKTVGDVMTPGHRAIDANVSIDEAARRMRRWDVREVFVTERDELRGLLTDTDIIALAIASGRPPATIPAGLSCDADVPRLRPDQGVEDALETMRRHGRRSLPVVDRAGRLAGTAWVDDLASASGGREAATARA